MDTENKKNEESIVWEAYEHTHSEKGADWFWALGIVAVASAMVAILLGNILFSLLIIVGAFTVGLLAKKTPTLIQFQLTNKGVVIGSKLYPYSSLHAFWISKTPEGDYALILDAQKIMAPHLIIPLPDETYEDKVRAYLEQYLPEEELFESSAHRILEIFGF